MTKAKNRPRPLVLMILDGYGISALEEGNAIRAAKQPNLDNYFSQYPIAAVKAAGIAVGLPWGEMGNSETGHQNIGSGRVLYQILPRIKFAIQDKSFFTNPAFTAAIKHVKQNKDSALHLVGLLSDGGVHSHIDHPIALLELAARFGLGQHTFVHAFLDDRDSPPESAGNFVNQLSRVMKQTGAGTLSTMIGRHFAMDRDNNWQRTQLAYNLLVQGQGTAFPNWQMALKSAYQESSTNSFETTPHIVITNNDQPARTITDGDAVIFFNYRSDRAIQLTRAFTQPQFNKFPVQQWANLLVVTMAPYHEDIPALVAFPEEHIEQPLGYILSQHNLSQLRIAESEKFAHVTYFLNGRRHEPFLREERVKIPSLKIKDYSHQPAMSAEQITDHIISTIQADTFDVIIVNYANPDMVAHTGQFTATVQALEFLDGQIGRVVEAALAADGAVLLTCDHGNAEAVVHQLTHQRVTDHTNNPVPLIYLAPDNKQTPPKSAATVQQILATPIGILADVAPTVLDILGLPQPDQMTATSLLDSLV